MPAPITLTPENRHYPRRLRIEPPPRTITVEGSPLEARRAVAIVGTRDPSRESERFAFDLAALLARSGAVVVSGGAKGIDAAAHRGALAMMGRTWCVAPNGRGRVYPIEHADLFDAIAGSEGAMVWPFPDGAEPWPGSFHFRNRVLAALSDAVVVVQASAKSGTRNAAYWARQLRRPIWVVGAPPWDERFTGCLSILDEGGARVITSMDALLASLDIARSQVPLFEAERARAPLRAPPPSRPLPPPPHRDDPVEAALIAACTAEPRHIDEIAIRARVCASAAATGLLTLALENVLLEGPEGFYRRGN